jgi:prevent-host-death family protein
MDTISASDAKSGFSALLDRVQTAPVIISRNGSAVAVVMSSGEFDGRLSFKLDEAHDSKIVHE